MPRFLFVLLVGLSVSFTAQAAPISCSALWGVAGQVSRRVVSLPLSAYLVFAPTHYPPPSSYFSLIQSAENATDEGFKAANPDIPIELEPAYLLSFVPTSIDKELGATTSKEIAKQKSPVQDETVQLAVKAIGERLVRALDRQEFPFSFTVLEDQSVNAFAIPGGPLFINSGLIKAVRNEAELAGVVAHEIAHGYLRHSTDQMIKQMGLTTIAQFVAGYFESTGTFSEVLQQMVGKLVTLRFSRQDEAEADKFAVRLMARAGYDPRSLAEFFKLLQDQPSLPSFLSGHPNPGDRVKAVLEEAQALNLPADRLSTGADLRDIQARLL